MAKGAKGFPLISTFSRVAAAIGGVAVFAVATLLLFGSPATAATPSPTTADTARLLGYMWGDGSHEDGVWNVDGPSGTSSLIEELVERHGGVWVNRQKLQFRLPAPYAWTAWKDGLPDGDATVRAAVENPHFLAALLETEADVVGRVYDQSTCCVPGYTRGRLMALVDLLHRRGFSSATLVEFGDIDSGKVTINRSEWQTLRATHRFVCPVSDDAIRVPGGDDHDVYGDIRWFDSTTRWSKLVRTDCVSGEAVPEVGPAEGTCAVSVVDTDRVHVSWTFTHGEAAIRRDGTFQESVSARDGSFSERPGQGSFSYVVRLQAFGVTTDAECGSVRLGDAVDVSCWVAEAARGVVIEWEQQAGDPTYQVRENGRWFVAVRGQNRLEYVGGSIDSAFTVRFRENGETVELGCSA